MKKMNDAGLKFDLSLQGIYHYLKLAASLELPKDRNLAQNLWWCRVESAPPLLRQKSCFSAEENARCKMQDDFGDPRTSHLLSLVSNFQQIKHELNQTRQQWHFKKLRTI